MPRFDGNFLRGDQMFFEEILLLKPLKTSMDARFQGKDFLVLFFITTYQGYVMPFLIELNNLIASYAKNESHKEQLACTAGPHRKANHAAVGRKTTHY